MHNLIILGSGRSGTSMAAGLFNKAGYFMGDEFSDPNPSNPDGRCECSEINMINEEILSQVLARRPSGIIGDLFFRKRPGVFQKWLARVPLGTAMSCPDEVKDRIRKSIAKEPFCFKDPRFSYTLPCWQPFLMDTRFLVVFRNPADTAKSIAKECNDASYLHNLSITHEDMLEVWQLMYSHILTSYRADGSWFFLHLDQMLDSQGLDRLEAFAGVAVDRSFPEQSLKRSVSAGSVSLEASRIYRVLCRLATYHG